MMQNGATEEEIEFLLHRRVELNAMTSRQIVDFVERKLQEHGIGKVVPDEDELNDAYRLFVRSREAEVIVKRELGKLNGGSPVQVPTNLHEQVTAYLAKHPTVRWDDAAAILANDS
jgi:hypothetical protein